MDDQGTEMVSFQLVAAAGEARSLAFEALEKAKAGDFDAAAKLMKQSKDAGIKAHHIQTQLLSTEAAGEHLSVDVLPDLPVASFLADDSPEPLAARRLTEALGDLFMGELRRAGAGI